MTVRPGPLPAALLVVLLALAPLVVVSGDPAWAAADVPTPRAGWGWPVGSAADPPRMLAAYDPPAQQWAAGHRGVDLAAEPAAPVRAAGPGVVGFAGTVAGRGVVTVLHPDGVRTTYEPVLPAVTAGTTVRGGDVLGVLAAAGHCAPRSCLHWGALRGRDYLDPLRLLRPARVRLLPTTTAGPAVPGQPAAWWPDPGSRRSRPWMGLLVGAP